MGGLLGLFDVGRSALFAQNAGAATVARNTANASTPGYSRESVELSAQLGAPIFGGVHANTPSRAADLLLAARERSQAGARAQAEDRALALGSLESALAPPSGGIDDRLAAFFGSLTELSASPLDPALRSQVLERADALGSSIRQAAGDIATARADADHRIAGFADTATRLANQIAGLNRAIGVARGGDPALLDQRELAAKQLSEVIGGTARIDPDGNMRVVLEGGQVLVDGDRAAAVRAVPDAQRGGLVSVRVVDGRHTSDLTAAIASGRLGAQLAFRDGDARRAADELDRLAYDLATNANAVHRANAGTDGGTGRNLFTEPGQIAGAALGFAVSTDVAGDPRKLATAAAGSGAGDTGGLSALIALGSAPIAGGGTRSFLEESIRAATAAGSARADATSDLQLQQARSDFLDSLRDSLSGVSPEEEMIQLSQIQHAAQAANQFIATVNDMLADLIQKI